MPGTSSRPASSNRRVPCAVSTSTPLGRLSSSGVPAATSSPRAMIATRSQTSSTSDSRCEFSSTDTPRSRSSSSSRRTVRRPAGSSALVGSSSSSTRGLPTIACAIPSRCCMPLDIAPTRRVAASVRPTDSSSRRALAGAAVRAREPLVHAEQLVGGQPVGEAEQLGQVAERAVRLRRAGGRAGEPRLAAGRADQPARDLDQRRLAGAVGPEQPDELAVADLEADALEGLDRPVRLVQIRRLERGWHH